MRNQPDHVIRKVVLHEVWLDPGYTSPWGDVPQEVPATPRCKHCDQNIQTYGVTIELPEEWVHVPGGYSLCIIDGNKPGTRAEPASQ